MGGLGPQGAVTLWTKMLQWKCLANTELLYNVRARFHLYGVSSKVYSPAVLTLIKVRESLNGYNSI